LPTHYNPYYCKCKDKKECNWVIRVDLYSLSFEFASVFEHTCDCKFCHFTETIIDIVKDTPSLYDSIFICKGPEISPPFISKDEYAMTVIKNVLFDLYNDKDNAIFKELINDFYKKYSTK
jgi:hypothetical protein